MTQKRKGILAAGNWIIDLVKIIDIYPTQDALANIIGEGVGNGGSAYNILKNLAKLEANFPLEGVGLIGNDDNGRIILDDCIAHGIKASSILISDQIATSYTDVMTVQGTGRRTFFHNRGANALLSREHINLKDSLAKIFHLGYLLLLDKLDELDANGRTGASYVFQEALELGFKTSADVVSENSNRFSTVVPPSLPYINYLFVNEYEAERITGITIGKNLNIDLEKAEDAAIRLLEMGVRDWVILHFSMGALAVNKKIGSVYQPSLKVPENLIVGAAGAGDAFASGTLIGLHEEWNMQDALKLGVSAAASSLFAAGCSDGVKPWPEALALSEKFGFATV